MYLLGVIPDVWKQQISCQLAQGFLLAFFVLAPLTQGAQLLLQHLLFPDSSPIPAQLQAVSCSRAVGLGN